MKRGNNPMPVRYAVALLLALWMLMPGAVHAHRLSVFAWVEGDTAHVQGKFAGGNYVQGGQVTVSGPDGAELITGQTDDQGTFSFQIPRKSDLKVVISAGMGHQGDWTIRADEITAPLPEPMTASSRPAEPSPDRGSARTADAPSPSEAERAAAVTPEAVSAAVEQALDKKLTPVIRMLAEERQAIGPTEIFGGIGYIFGLVGVAAYFASRRKRGSQGEDGRL